MKSNMNLANPSRLGMSAAILATSILTATLITPSNGWSWGADGHRIVCKIAMERLSPEAEAMVEELLGTEGTILHEVCSWADQVRGQNGSHPETGPYHYINTPPGSGGIDMDRDCPDVGCVVWAIPHYGRILANRSATILERTEALKFLAHFIGDLHQPLHAGRPGDRGGNDTFTSFLGDSISPFGPLNLHSVWDTRIIGRDGAEWSEKAHLLTAEISRGEALVWSNVDVLEWADESYRITDGFIYPELPESGIGETYYAMANEISELRLKQGGVRLAHILNLIALGESPY